MHIKMIWAALMLITLLGGGAGCRTAEPAATAPSPVGATWILSATPLPDAPARPAGMRIVTMQVTPEGRIAGCSGVNRYTGRVEVVPEQQVFRLPGPPAVTRMAGPGMEFENYYLALLQKIDRYRFVGDRLELLEGDKPILEFRPAN